MKANKTKKPTNSFIASLSELGGEATMNVTVNDFKNSLILVSVGINVTIFTAWMVLTYS